MMHMAGALLLLFGILAGSDPAGEIYAWQRTDIYAPPDFEGFFPDDLEGGAALDRLMNAPDKDQRPDVEVLETVRNGLRHTREHVLTVLRWLGNKYILGQSPQHPAAIELMYHASASPDRETAHDAVYFGLSVVEVKTPAILRALADLCMRSDDPNDLGRIAWGVSGQQEAAVACLEPYRGSSDAAVREKCRVVEQILGGELDAFEWAQDKARQRAQAEYGGRLPEFREDLLNGDSEKREAALAVIEAHSIILIMDDDFLDAWQACARDPDPDIRRKCARLLGSRWIWGAQSQHPAAIEILLGLSEDADPEVRYLAVYHGLSVVRDKDDRVLKRLVELTIGCTDRNLFDRIAWGVRGCGERVAAVLDEYLAQHRDSPSRTLNGRECYRKLLRKEPPGVRDERPKTPVH
jgi:hypothetical protein